MLWIPTTHVKAAEHCARLPSAVQLCSAPWRPVWACPPNAKASDLPGSWASLLLSSSRAAAPAAVAAAAPPQLPPPPATPSHATRPATAGTALMRSGRQMSSYSTMQPAGCGQQHQVGGSCCRLYCKVCALHWVALQCGRPAPTNTCLDPVPRRLPWSLFRRSGHHIDRT